MTIAFRREMTVQAGGRDLIEAVVAAVGRGLDDGVRVLQLTLILGDEAVDAEEIATIIADAHADAPTRRATVGMVNAAQATR